MRLEINGEWVEVPEPIKVITDLLRHFQLEHRMVVIEHNRVILEREAHREAILTDGDRIEIVHFVGGG